MSGDVAPIVPSFAELHTVVERACQPPTSESRAKQLRWVAGELRRAFDRGDLAPSADQSLADLLAPENVAAYLRAAELGVLRRKPSAQPDKASSASMDVREDCLGILGRTAGINVEVPDRDSPRVVNPVVAARPRSILLHHLEEQATRAGQSPPRLRILAVLGMVMDTGCRAGEACALRLSDLGPALDTVRLTRFPQRRDLSVEPEVETVALSLPTRSALQAWLRVRANLVMRDPSKPSGPENSTTDFLWVSVTNNGQRRPGLPLQFRGLARAYVREIDELNMDMAGEPGWEPMPARMEQLRRAIELECAGEAAGDTDGVKVLRRAPVPPLEDQSA